MIRLAKIEDLEGVVEIYNQAIIAGFQTAFTEPFHPNDRADWLSQHIGTTYPMFVYEVDGKVAGWLSIAPYRQGRAALRRTVEISYFVNNEYQNRGIGTALVSHALTACVGLNFHVALAIIIDKNTASIRLMEKFGFEKWGYLPGVAEFGVVCGQVYYGREI